MISKPILGLDQIVFVENKKDRRKPLLGLHTVLKTTLKLFCNYWDKNITVGKTHYRSPHHNKTFIKFNTGIYIVFSVQIFCGFV